MLTYCPLPPPVVEGHNPYRYAKTELGTLDVLRMSLVSLFIFLLLSASTRAYS